MTADPAALLAALDVLEEAEARNLAWSLLDESWTRDELLAVLERAGTKDPPGCLDGLLEGAYVVQLPKEWPSRYRTRMSEAVRLFSHLRQLFPGKPWQSGALLVSDFRFVRRARSFPRRDITADEAVAALAERGVPSAERVEATRLLGTRRLSRFQLNATGAVLAATREQADRGVVVGAGTGSGKTLAFYLPALSRTAAAGAAGPRIVAIYPRNELLKDQLATALGEVRRLRATGGRPLTIGAFFGPTPFSNDRDPDERSGWRRRGSAWVCPFLACPAEHDGTTCGGQLIWNRPAHGTGTPAAWGQLACQRCRHRVEPDELRLTRPAMQEQPPDILFTTTEMLNQELSNGWTRHVFGVGPRSKRAPQLVLLDEIHTYTGTSGAQVAFLLRRWRKLLGKPVTWVGLSATLANAGTFFTDLCGLPPEAVADIRPEPEELVHQGSEYQLLLRGDPASQAALLSTSIQSLMLLRRILDEKDKGVDSPFGTRVFAFLENLDLVNRLYRQLLSAEGRNPIGERDAKQAVLAGLRIPEYAEHHGQIDDPAAWNRDGQHWWLPETLGFGARSLEISRTSSQDTGVDSGADIVVATSSLEVGYDDPRVGAVLQHKAPRDIAQFLQRRGRAGRQQIQRPWTVVVLSDYGRDRLAFQSYESILDPSVPAKSLPLGNQSVRKMQAAMCMVDWMAVRLGVDAADRWNLRAVLRATGGTKKHADLCRHLLAEVLAGGATQADLVDFVRASLNLTQEDTEAICWEHPRSLLLEAAPTAYRRLRSDWATLQQRKVVPGTDVTARQPLPEFIPSTLFSDLFLPEVEVSPPSGYDPAAATSIGIGMALNELAPGKVTLRWAVRKVRGLWIEVPESDAVNLEAGLAPGGETIGEVPGPEGPVPLVRPLIICPTIPPPAVKATSNGRLRWCFRFDGEATGTRVPRPRNGPLGELVPDVRAFLNVDHGPLKIWRYAVDGSAEIVTSAGRKRREYTFVRGGERVALGFDSAVDALMVTVAIPTSVDAFALQTDAARLRQFRSDRFAALARAGLEARGLGPFVAAWVTEVALSVAAEHAVGGGGLHGLLEWSPGEWQSAGGAVVDGVLLATRHAEIDETPLRDTVLTALADQEVVDVLASATPALSQDPDDTWLPWVRSRFLHTVAAAWQYAAQQLCLDFNVDADALIDIVDLGGSTAHVVVCDASPGGGGLVEALARRIADDPRRFDALVAASVEPSDTEEVDLSLRRALNALVDVPAVARAASRFRASGADRLAAWQALLAALGEHGVARTHVSLAALATRIFRPGSSPASDDLLRLLLQRWDERDFTAGFAVDHRAVCSLLAADPAVLEKLQQVTGAAPGDRQTTRHATHRAQSVLLSMLWTRAHARRPESLRTSNRFVSDPPPTERTLLKALLPHRPPAVNVDDAGWRANLADSLRVWGRVPLSSGSNDLAALAAAVRGLMVEPLEMEWLRVHPQVDAVLREGGSQPVVVALREAPQ